ncbi:MAG: hypothetical protein OHK0015_46840 [Chloroflexi bacterium OHK40]
MAYLAITGQPQPRSVLIDLFFQEADDPAAALRLLLARIRSKLGSHVLRTLGRQVSLDPAAYWLDLRVFDALLGSDPSARPYTDLVAAMQLVRGPLLDQLYLPSAPEFNLWLLGERARVQRRLAQVLQRLRDESAVAHDIDRAIGYARMLVESSPLLEEAHARLIQLYVQSGQVAAALTQFEQCRDILARELAVAPTRDLQSLRDLIANSMEPMAVQEAARARLPPLDTLTMGFRERDHLLEQLQAIWEQAAAGRGGVVLLVGEAGSGKTRLLHEFARRLDDQRFYLGSCAEITQQIPYEPWAALLEGALRAADLAAQPPLWRDYLLRLLPGLAAQIEVAVPSPPPTAGGEAERLFAAVAEVLVPANAPPRLVAIEDLHWADQASLQLFGYLARQAAERAVLLVGTVRTESQTERPALQRVLDELDQRAVVQLAITPLGEAAVVVMAQRLLSQVDKERAAQVGALISWATGGNALFVTELLRELATYPELPGELPIPGSVRELVGRQLTRLREGERQVLEALAVLAAPASLDEATDISARGADEVERAITLGLSMGLLISDPSTPPGSYRFGHHLPREAVVAQLTLARRQILHRRVAQRLDRAAANQPHDARLAVAEQLLYHARAGDAPELALRWTLPAAERAAQLYHYQRALQIIDQGLDDYARRVHSGHTAGAAPLYAELRLRRIPLLSLLGRPPSELQQSLALAEEYLEQHSGAVSPALLALSKAHVLLTLYRYEESSQQALDAYQYYVDAEDLRAAAACLVLVGSNGITSLNNRTGRAYYDQALTIYRALDDHDGQSACMYGIGWASLQLGEIQEAIDRLDEALRLALAQRSTLREARARYILAVAWSFIYHFERMEASARRAAELYAQLGMDEMHQRSCFFLAIAEENLHDLAQAEVSYAGLWAAASQRGDEFLAGWAAHALGRCAILRGDLATAQTWLERAIELRRRTGQASIALLDLIWLGRLALARGEATRALEYCQTAIEELQALSDEIYVVETADMYMAYAQALAANGNDPAARVAQAQAQAELARVAAQLRDAQSRHYYLTESPLALRIRAEIA